jgi:hypothetical protein
MAAVLVTLLGIGIGVALREGNTTETVNQTVNEKTIIMEPSEEEPPASKNQRADGSKPLSKGKARRQRGGATP